MSVPSDPTARKLAAIMFTDMVGYTALVEHDEGASLDLLEEHRTLARPLFERYGGREVRTMGDGFMVEFASAVEAVECAIALQTTLQARNTRSVSGHRILLRIGIHVGDVVAREGDLFGTAVNVAARILPLAPPGGICVSRQVRDQVRGLVSHPLSPMGAPPLKNLEVPIELFSVAFPWLEPPPSAVARRGPRFGSGRFWIWTAVGLAILAVSAWSLHRALEPPLLPPSTPAAQESPWVDSIAVLPFVNLTPDPDNEYFSDGITEELIDGLARLEGLKVCARTSVFAFKDKEADVRTIGRRLGVNLVLEGSVRQAGDRFKVTAQLIRTLDGFHVWSDSMVTEAVDPLVVQETIARNVVRNLQGRLGREGAVPVGRPATILSVYQLYQQGRRHWSRRTQEDLEQAVDFYTRALRQDPAFAPAELGLAETYAILATYGTPSRDEYYRLAKEHAQGALRLDPQLAEAHTTMGWVLSSWDWQWDEASRAFERAVALKPGYATAHQWFALHLRRLGRLEEALREARLARDLDPLSLVIRSSLGDLYLDRREYGEAEKEFQAILRAAPGFFGLHTSLASLHMRRGRWDEALAELRLESVDHSYWKAMNQSMIARVEAHRGETAGAREAAAEMAAAIRNAREPHWMFVALIHCALRDPEPALEWMDQALLHRDLYFFYSVLDPEVDFLRSHPRFRQLLRRYGLSERLAETPGA